MKTKQTDQMQQVILKNGRGGVVPEYVSYRCSKSGFALLVLEKSVGDRRTLIGFNGKTFDLFEMKAVAFESKYTKVGAWDRNASWPDVLEDPARTALRIILAGKPISKVALEQIERIAKMDTRGKSSEQIRTEVIKLSADLPKGHPMKDVPKAYPDRGQAIASYTQMRQAIYQLTKEKEMSVQSTEKPSKVKSGATKGGVEKEAKAPSKAKVTKPVTVGTISNDTPEPKKGSKAVKVEPASAKKVAEPKEKKVAEPKKERAEAVDLTGPFKLSAEAKTAGNPEALRLHEGSSRYTLMAHIFKNAAKKPKGFTVEELKEVVGGQTKQALSGMVRYGFLEAV